MPTDKGVIQGYTGVAAVDERHQIIVEAQAHGTGSEQELLQPVTEAIEPMAKEHTVVCTDSGYYSEAGLKQLEAKGIEAFIPDNQYRKRDARYTGQDQHTAKPDALWDKRAKTAERATERMKRKIDTDQGREMIAPALRHGGAGVRQPAIQQGAHPLHPTRKDQSRRAVEALLSGAQHREAGAQRLREVRGSGKMTSTRSTQQQSRDRSRDPLPLRTAQQAERGRHMMAILGCRKPVLRQPR
jgi:ribonuclease HI